MKLKYLLFDLDGVLVNSEELAMRAEISVFDKLGLDISQSEYQERLLGLSEDDYHIALDRLWIEKHTGSVPSGLQEQLRAARWVLYEQELKAMPYAVSFLNANMFQIAVVSSSTRDSISRKLELSGLSDYFGEKIFSSDDVENSKPAPDVYLLAKSKISEAQAACLALEDSRNGVVSAVGAGYETWGFIGEHNNNAHSKKALTDAGATKLVRGFPDLSELLGMKK